MRTSSMWALLVPSLVLAAPPPDAAKSEARGARLVARARYADAVEPLEAAVKADPKFALAVAELGWAKYKLGLLDEARTAETQALAVATTPAMRAAILYNLGRIELADSSLADAGKHLRESLKLRPGNASTAAALTAVAEHDAWVRLAGWDDVLRRSKKPKKRPAKGAAVAEGDDEPDFEVRFLDGPLAFAPRGGGSFVAALLERHDVTFDPDSQTQAEVLKHALVVAKRAGGKLVLVDRRDCGDGDYTEEQHPIDYEARLGILRLGAAGDALLYEHRTAAETRSHEQSGTATVYTLDDAGKLFRLLEHPVESGNSTQNVDVVATLAARDLDGDGTAEIIADESRASFLDVGADDPMAAQRTVVYRLRDRRYTTSDKSLFDERMAAPGGPDGGTR